MTFQPPDVKSRTIAVLGGGTLGRRIALAWAVSGYDVIVREIDEHQVPSIQHFWEEFRPSFREKLGKSQAQGSLEITSSLEDAVKSAWLVIESVPEIPELKKQVLADVEKLVAKDCLVGSNSSSFKSSALIQDRSPDFRRRVFNIHYQMPPDYNMVELMTCGETQEGILDFLSEQVRACNMRPIPVVRESTGFILNRIWAAIKRECVLAHRDGVGSAELIDEVFCAAFGTSFAPFKMMDKVGLDTVINIEKHYVDERGLAPDVVDYLQHNFLDKGRYGQKSTNGGFYSSLPSPTPAQPAPSKEVSSTPAKPSPTIYFLNLGNFDVDKGIDMGRLVAAQADGSAYKVLVDRLPMPDGVEVEDNRIWLSNMGSLNRPDGTILSCNLDGSDLRTIISGTSGVLHTPKQLKLDPVSQKIYVCDREGMKILRCNYDGSQQEIIYRSVPDSSDASVGRDQKNWCVGITVDPAGGYFYWTQKGHPKSNTGRIFRAPIATPADSDPAARSDVQVVAANLPEPIDLDIDPAGGFLYWTDRGEVPFGNTLNRLSLADISAAETTSGAKHTILAHNLHEAIGIKVDTHAEHIYVADLGGTVYRFNLDGSHKQKMYDDLGAYTGITVAYAK